MKANSVFIPNSEFPGPPVGQGAGAGPILNSVRKLVSSLTQQLSRAGSESAQAEAEWLLAGLLGLSRTELYLQDVLNDCAALRELPKLVEQRLEGVPLQYLIGSTEFCGLRLAVSPAVFIPRPETEVLAERMGRYLAARQTDTHRLRLLDMGTGSGCLAVYLAMQVPSCVLVACELSWEALRVACMNAVRHGVRDRVALIQTDWTTAVRGPFDAIISNPPYVRRQALAPRQAGHGDPLMSLDGGVDGMLFHNQLIGQAETLLAGQGVLCMECAEDQAAVLTDHLRQTSWVATVEIVEDLAGRPRGVWAQRIS